MNLNNKRVILSLLLFGSILSLASCNFNNGGENIDDPVTSDDPISQEPNDPLEPDIPDPVVPDPVIPDPIVPESNEHPPVNGETYEEDNKCYYTIENRSDVYLAIENSWGEGCGYPSILETNHSLNKENKGILLCAFTIANSGKGYGPTWIQISKSIDNGDTWEECGKVYETIDTSLEACWNPCLFELPEKVGQYNEGTIVLAGCSIDAAQKVKSQLPLWISEDEGNTWEEISIICDGTAKNGVWEPHLIYENGYLYCFFADDRGDGEYSYDQTIAYMRTRDLLNWENTVGVVYGESLLSRPGMPVVTKMGNGEYFLVYEYGLNGADNGVPIYYKKSKYLDKWGKYDDGSKLYSTNGSDGGSAPFALWFDKGGECGTLLITSCYGSNTDNKIFISHDYGESFNLIDNFLPYNGGNGLGYHSSYVFSSDGETLYGVNTVNNTETKGKIEFARIRVASK